MTAARAPRSTYRLQIRAEFTLADAEAILDYLVALGADWVYLSPLLAAVPGSSHGYNTIDHSRIDPERGGEAGFEAFAAAAHARGLGVLLDIVPNHVGVERPEVNPWWWSVLREGEGSPYADYFDIDWAFGGGKLRIPVLGEESVEAAAAAGAIVVSGGELRYHDHRYPVAQGTADDGADAVTVHSRQHYELMHWRRADHELNYRRFFAVNELAAVRVEVPAVFEASHRLVLDAVADGRVDGLRVDHPDGLADPRGYLDTLAAATAGAYVLVEKILEQGVGETLPREWAADGTTGYDALALIDRVLIDPVGVERLHALDARLRGAEDGDGDRDATWHTLVHDGKRGVADTILGSEVARLVREYRAGLVAAGDATGDPDNPDNSVAADPLTDPAADAELLDAMAELLTAFPVYRSYLPVGREHLDAALHAATARRPELTATLARLHTAIADSSTAVSRRFAQTSGMVMAKGVEDTAFYRTSVLGSLTEVGAEPSIESISPAQFHAAQRERQLTAPHTMTALSTHDTKRSEDTRARIDALSEVPAEWEEFLDRRRAALCLDDGPFENLLWQAIVGSWPRERTALHGYAEKASREAAVSTTWSAPNAEFEARMHALVDSVFDDAEVAADVEAMVALIAEAGRSNGLAAKLVQLTGPGVPDVYQGSELWERSLVDPDNRRPVDYAERVALLARLDEGWLPPVDESGAAKLLVTTRALRLRRDHPHLFGDYLPLAAQGSAAAHALAADRRGVVTVATRLPHGLARAGGWGETVLPLPTGVYRDELTGARHVVSASAPPRLETLLSRYPVALLVRERVSLNVAGESLSVWAPAAEHVEAVIDGVQTPLTATGGGWFSGPVLAAGKRYGFRLDGADEVLPDPRGRRLPDGVHGLSAVDDPRAFSWTDGAWPGLPLAGAAIYELHVGTFSAGDGPHGAGTLDSAIAHLDELASLGVTAVELLPVNGFNGDWNWGYDGVAWFAVSEVYGGPEAYRRFVDAAHARGIAVIQDVVYNHLGPSGNYLPRFGPYLRSGLSNTWGESVNLDDDEVRRFILDNVAMWLRDFRVDGLRLDAVHALHDSRRPHLLAEIGALGDEIAAERGFPVSLIAESDLNDPVMFTPRPAGGYGLSAQWSDDVHHAIHVALSGETSGYYADFAEQGALAKVLAGGFFHDGTWSSFRGRFHGLPIDEDEFTHRLVVFSQDHDQIGNRAAGDRLTAALSDDRLAIAATLTIASPFTPMLFMGEEWGARTPWQFFTAHPEPELGEIVARGRISEFARMGWDESVVPNPQDPATFLRSRLDRGELADPSRARIHELYGQLLRLRRDVIRPVAVRFREVSAQSHRGGLVTVVRWPGWAVAVNLSDAPFAFTAPGDLDSSSPWEAARALSRVEAAVPVAEMGPVEALAVPVFSSRSGVLGQAGATPSASSAIVGHDEAVVFRLH